MTIQEILAKPCINVDEFCTLTNYSKAYVYTMTSRKRIPHFKRGKLVIFNTKEIVAWLQGERVQTSEDMEQEAATINELKRH